MSDATPFEIRASIVPKSDQLNSDDLLTGPITVTIENVRRGDKEQPIIVEISDHRPYKPCKSMRRILIAAFSDDPKKWVGQRMTLFCDPEVSWAGVKVGGIRISHLSGLDKPKTFMLTQTRGKRAEVTIHPLPADATLAHKPDYPELTDAAKAAIHSTPLEKLPATIAAAFAKEMPMAKRLDICKAIIAAEHITVELLSKQLRPLIENGPFETDTKVDLLTDMSARMEQLTPVPQSQEDEHAK